MVPARDPIRYLCCALACTIGALGFTVAVMVGTGLGDEATPADLRPPETPPTTHTPTGATNDGSQPPDQPPEKSQQKSQRVRSMGLSTGGAVFIPDDSKVVDREVKRSSQRIRQNVRSLNESIRRMNVTINQIGNLNRRWSTIRRLR